MRNDYTVKHHVYSDKRNDYHIMLNDYNVMRNDYTVKHHNYSDKRHDYNFSCGSKCT
jgi:hypothetical protein